SVLKIPVRLPAVRIEEAGEVAVLIKFVNAQEPFEMAIKLKARMATALHKRTFLSNMDSSVQYFATRPASGTGGKPKALILTLHGAGVEAWGQAAAYSSKSWGHIVAATNRRPFGFDWEDWGRRDAIEVLNHAQRIYRTDVSKTYLTGHSIGGHGTWQVGATYADRFAAIAPSAGWISFWTYGGARKAKGGSVAELFQRAMSGSDTLGLSANYKGLGIYILHGGGDKNVPPTQARTMVKHLSSFHKNFRYHEEPKVGHWWDKDRKEPGADCVDWRPMFDFFARSRAPDKSELKALDFSTANPGISASHHWLRVETQAVHGAISSVQARVGAKGFYGRTKNVSKLSFDLSVLPKQDRVEVELDGDSLQVPWPNKKRLVLARGAKGWSLGEIKAAEKGPRRYGPFKEAFTNQVVLVYGTSGTAAENRWALAKARYDSETFMYRGNGSLRLVPDFEFNEKAHPDHNVVLYGHREMNSAWSKLLGKSPIQVKRGECRIGEKVVNGKDLATLFVWPRAGSTKALVGVVAGTSLVGMRVTERCPYFVSGVAYPDLTILTPQSVFRGDDGVVVTGYFGHDWSVKSGQFAWGN
ncbi:MAG: prolyl oligopeptidase family serine peptidase, partial [Planctomycetota bacterium]|nr:prolyl oligopeptidase family serine peptidase [Planctomycetota bacterium]